MDERLTKRIPDHIWSISLKLINENQELKKDFNDWLLDHLDKKMKPLSDTVQGFEKRYIKSASDDENVIQGYMSEYIWDRYGSILDFVSDNEELVLNRIAAES